MKEALDVKENQPRLSAVKQYSSTIFEGVCIDTGAQKTVCGLAQAKAYSRATRKPFCLMESPFSYKFGNRIWTSLGMIQIQMQIRNGLSFEF